MAPTELENILVSHPAISDAAVIGLPDDQHGELPRAYVVVAPGATINEQEILRFMKGEQML